MSETFLNCIKDYFVRIKQETGIKAISECFNGTNGT